MAKRQFECRECGYLMEVPYDVARYTHCPQCNSSNLHRTEEYVGHSRDLGKTKGRGSRGKVRSWDSWHSRGI